MAVIGGALERVLRRLERIEQLDPIAEATAAIVGRVIPRGRVKNLATGTEVAHPLHPPLAMMPMGAWLAASFLDLAGGSGSQPAARRLIAAGVLASAPAVVAGAADWLDTSDGERRVGLIHGAGNAVAIGCYGASWLLRRRGRRTLGVASAGIGASVITVTGWLGGHLAYAMGVGVDTTAFQRFPAKWTDVGAVDDFSQGSGQQVNTDGVPLLVVRSGNSFQVLADRCTHRGAPLHEGKVAGGCVTCPWHDSVFALADGAVVHGPATRPQPALESRVRQGRLQVRRPDESHSLRTNPVGGEDHVGRDP